MSNQRQRLETEAIVIGYAMSRLDQNYVSSRNCTTWTQAFAQAAAALSRPPLTFKNLRDEFDPVHPNDRQGWHKRNVWPSRQRVLDELKDVSDEALLELVDRILHRDEDAVVEAIDSLATVTHVAANVAERLLTGRKAEVYFLNECYQLIQVPSNAILDNRQSACGFDFGVKDHPNWAIEVKGLKQSQGDVLFTDREWLEAKIRQENYWVVVVGNLIAQPKARIIKNPHRKLAARSAWRKSITVEWHATVTIDR